MFVFFAFWKLYCVLAFLFTEFLTAALRLPCYLVALFWNARTGDIYPSSLSFQICTYFDVYFDEGKVG